MPPPTASGWRPGRRTVLALGAAAFAAACGAPSSPPPPAPWQLRLRDGTDARPREIGVLGDSIAFGGGGWGSSAPKWRNSFVGRLRDLLVPTWGDAGTGWVLLNQALWPTSSLNQGWDPRLVVSGAVGKAPLGPFRRSCARIPSARGRAPSDHVELTATGSTFSTFVLASGGGRAVVSVDGGDPLRLADGRAPDAYDVAPRSGTPAAHLVTDIPTGGPGVHTLRVWAEGGSVDLVALRASTGTGRLALTSAAVSGESLQTFCGPGADDARTGAAGLPYLDSFAFDLLVLELGANDYNAGRPLDQVRPLLTAVVERQQTRGGDVLLLFPPISSPKLYPGAGAPSYEAYGQLVGEVARERDVPFLDLTRLWGASFEESAALRPPRYADDVHPSDAGAADIAERCRSFLEL